MPIKISLTSTDPLSVVADLAVIGVAEGALQRSAAVETLSKALGPVVAKTLKRDEFTGKKDQMVDFATGAVLKPARVLLVGLGGAGELTGADVRLLAAKGARFASGIRASSLVIELPPGVAGAERAAAEGVVLGAYRFTKYLTGDRLPKFTLERAALAMTEKVSRQNRDAAVVGQRVGEAICIARDLINEPPNELYPEVLARAAVAMCKANGLKCTVFDKAALVKRGMKLIVAVGQGSAHDPRLVHMTYTPRRAAKKKIVFVGKGLTFDSGGICIKPAPGMEEMKGDMGGAANVIALMAAVAATNPPVEVHGIIGCAENMPDGNAYRPGDIFGSLDGKTVEIINTDAEGRLVLADVLAYGRDLKPDVMLDNATLTGACIVALGPTVSGFYSNQDALAARLKRCADATGEAMWHMPLVEDLRDGLKSDWADLKHTADRWGGSITAALFLREFVGDTPWIHVDIAGPSTASKPYNVYAKGGTGHGVLTYLKLVSDLASD
jgi:leucyl aminopeptidase